MSVHLIETAKILIPENRQRREFDLGKLNELGESIQRNGLLNPVVLREVEDGFAIVAGERRLRAVQDLYSQGLSFTHGTEVVPEGFIPYTTLGELSPLAAMEAEYEENVRRVDLSWQEHAAATAGLQDLRRAQARDQGTPAPKVADLSLEVRGSSKGYAHETTRRELILAQHLQDPTVAKAKTLDEAFKLLKRKEQTEKYGKLAEILGKSLTHDRYTLLNEDAVAWMEAYEGPLFDVILTDPPYGMNSHEFGDAGGFIKVEHDYKDTPEVSKACYQALATEGFRITAADAHLYAFCDFNAFQDLKTIFTEAGWRVFQTPMIWHKPNAYRAPWPEQGPQRKYETILYAVKGAKPVTVTSSDVITALYDPPVGHAAHKPVALFQELLTRSCRPGNRILDPFCGSGPIFPASHALQVIPTGIELDPAHYGRAAARIQALLVELP